MKKSVLLLTALALSACASASDPGAMAVAVSEATLIKDDSPLRENVALGAVSGGKETNPLWTSEVSSDDFAEALRQSLAAHAMLDIEGAKYRLDAELVELKQPFAGFNMTVTSNVNYTLTDTTSDEVVYEETVSNAYTAQMGDAFVGTKRLQLANEGSIRGNIEAMLSNVVAKFGGEATMMEAPSMEDASDMMEDAADEAVSG